MDVVLQMDTSHLMNLNLHKLTKIIQLKLISKSLHGLGYLVSILTLHLIMVDMPAGWIEL